MKSYNNCFLNVNFAQIVLKKALFQARPASVHAQS